MEGMNSWDEARDDEFQDEHRLFQIGIGNRILANIGMVFASCIHERTLES